MMRLCPENKSVLLDWIDFIGLALIGLYCLCASLFISDFAEINLRLPFLSFPIFIGEILMLICIVLLGVKFLLNSKIEKWHWRWAVYGAWILTFAFLGFVQWGPLALRNAALFYYVIFALFSYSFYNTKILGNRYILSGVLVLLLSFLFFNHVVVYFWYTYVVLSIFIVSKVFKGGLRAGLIVTVLLLSHLSYLCVGKRAHMIAVICAVVLFFLLWSVYVVRLDMKIRVFLISLFVVVLVFSSVKLGNSNSVQSLLGWSTLVNLYSEKMKFLKEHKALRPIKHERYSFYNPNPLRKKSNKNYLPPIIQEFNKQNLKYEKELLLQQAAELEIKPIIKEPHEQLNPLPKSTENVSLSPSPVSPVIHGQTQEEPNLPKVVVADEDEQPPSDRNLEVAFNNILFRVFIWQDMAEEMWINRQYWGVGFGHPLRSPSIETLDWATTEWTRDGWISPHNFLFHIIYRAGVVGVAIIFIFFGIILKMKSDLIRCKDVFGLLFWSALIYWIVQASFSVTLELPQYAISFWTMFGMIFAYVMKDKRISQTSLAS